MLVDTYEYIRTHPTVRRLHIGDVLFARYTCPAQEDEAGIWAHTDHFVHILTGKKTWRTHAGGWIAEAGETHFFKKGAYVAKQHFEEDFCVFVFFVPDAVIRETVKELAAELPVSPAPITSPPGMRVESSTALSAFLQAMAVFFDADETPAAPLLRLKLRELLTAILVGHGNTALVSYLRGVASRESVSIPEIMEACFCRNQSMSELARLCHRSLSSFKRDFRRHYDKPPGRWLLERRLDHAAMLLSTSSMTVTQIGLECGFVDLSHFCRAFRDRFGSAPRTYRDGDGATVAAPGPLSP